MRYMRRAKDTGTVEELRPERWLGLAEDNVRDVQLAIDEGFETLGAFYWTEVPL